LLTLGRGDPTRSSELSDDTAVLVITSRPGKAESDATPD